ncbi:MAG: Rieske 2Fe-2S domain-containing protein [Terracidiphilus sp.]
MSTSQEKGSTGHAEGTTQTTARTTGQATGQAEAKAAVQSRRAFLFKLSLALNGAVGAVVAVPILGYLLGPALKKNASYQSWVSLGSINDFPEGETRLVDYRNPVTMVSDGMTGNVACWVRRIEGKRFQVFAINCAHLGCPVRWFAQSRLFLCPCHGGAYYEDGSRASGPPERGLFEYKYTVAGNHLLIEAGSMPTLAGEACNKKKPLVQIAPQALDGAGAEDASSARSS